MSEQPMDPLIIEMYQLIKSTHEDMTFKFEEAKDADYSDILLLLDKYGVQQDVRHKMFVLHQIINDNLLRVIQSDDSDTDKTQQIHAYVLLASALMHKVLNSTSSRDVPTLVTTYLMTANTPVERNATSAGEGTNTE